MKKLFILLSCVACVSLIFAEEQTKLTSSYNGYRFKLRTVEYFDYNQRFEGRQVLGSKGEYLCLKGTLIFTTPLEETPTAIKKTCGVKEAVSDKGMSLLFEEEEEENYIENPTNIGSMIFYLNPLRKKESAISLIKGKAFFKIPVKQNSTAIKSIHECPWFPIYKGRGCFLIFQENQNTVIYVILKYTRGNAQKINLLKLYLLDIENDEKNILWHYTSFKDSLGNTIRLYRTKFYFEKKENIYLIINDKDYEIKKIIGPPFPNLKNINVFKISARKGKKRSKYLYMITLPKYRPRKYNWAFVNISSKSTQRNRFSLKRKQGSVAEKQLIIFKEFTNILNKYKIKYLGLFQAEKFIKKAVPFQFKNIFLEEEEEE